MNPKTLVVLGMHRSATSLVARALAHYHPMGEQLLGGSPSNPHGHFEDLDFLKLDIAILSAAGGAWNEPPSEARILEQAGPFSARIGELVSARNRAHTIWGWKDPRTTLTVPLFRPHLRSPIYIACFRDPGEIADSLARRDGMRRERALRLARGYQRRLLGFLSTVCGIDAHFAGQ